jgi:3'(2'), 5'-bisphosphate nucleotidase
MFIRTVVAAMSSMPLFTEMHAAVHAVVKACRVSELVRSGMTTEHTHIKEDTSPVTVADFAVQALVLHELAKAFPSDSFIGEETSTELRADSDHGSGLKDKVMAALQSYQLTEDQVLSAIDRGDSPGGASGRIWALDPIDGTKGFLRNDQYAIALGLIKDGRVEVGVLGCPNLVTPLGHGVIFYAARGAGAFSAALSNLSDNRPVHVSVQEKKRSERCERCVSNRATCYSKECHGAKDWEQRRRRAA